MRILVVNWQDRENRQSGGAEIHMHEVFRRIAARGHEVTLLCSGWSGCRANAVVDGLDVHRVGTRYTYPFLARRYWKTVLEKRGYEVLWEDINKVPLYTPRWGAERVVAFVPHLFGETVFSEAGPFMGSAVWLAERPIGAAYRDTEFEALSESTRDDLVGRGLSADQVRVIVPGVEFERYTPDATVRGSVPTFAYLGRLKKYKRVDLIIRAFALIADKSSVLEIAGAGDYRPALEELVESLDLRRRVRFLGFVTEAEKLALYRRSWAVALTSPKEGWGLTNLEAAACGTPVIASDSPGLRESLRHEETGYLVPHGDVAALASRMAELSEAPATVARLGAAARRFAETFTWERAARETEAHLREVVEAR
ncbi:MAG TPA: glycosyltransferase family 4 protein [Gemmatimonadaceae bacterium]|nr:glycosyltransferase family 4 protein [Gemmatimonadaceae bacterium]